MTIITKPRAHEWPTRERWADSHPYFDGDNCPYDRNYSHKLSDYATSKEITTLTVALKGLYRELGRELQAANLRAKPLDQQRGEGGVAWYKRFHQMSHEDQEAWRAADNLKRERSAINHLLTRIRDDKIPNETRTSNFVPGKAGELVAPFNARYWAAFEAARDAYFREYAAQHPPDDAAWERELKWRADIERYRNSREP
jgi:hypothetical protein